MISYVFHPVQLNKPLLAFHSEVSILQSQMISLGLRRRTIFSSFSFKWFRQLGPMSGWMCWCWINLSKQYFLNAKIELKKAYYQKWLLVIRQSNYQKYHKKAIKSATWHCATDAINRTPDARSQVWLAWNQRRVWDKLYRMTIGHTYWN